MGNGAGALILGQVTVLKLEVALLALAPRALPVEVHALLVLLRNRLRLRVPLEPRQVLYVERPGLAFELLRHEVSAERVHRSVSVAMKSYEWHWTLTAGTCLGGNRTHRKASQHPAARSYPAC